MDKNFSYDPKYPFGHVNISTEYTEKEKKLQEEIDALRDILKQKQKELAIFQKENVLNYISSCNKNFNWGETIYNLTTGKSYFVSQTSPLQIIIQNGRDYG